ncbi:MAG: hypothetical protein ACXWKO_10660, partial [Phenylobacterium sp.]
GSDISAAPGAPAPRVRRLRQPATIALVLVALVMVAVGTGLAWRLAVPGPARVAGQNGRVDVMMFAAQGGDPTLPKIAEDLSDSIVRVLSGAGVQVTARPLSPDSAGSDSELRIAGAMERDQENYVVNAQVLDRRSGQVLWSDRIVRSPREQASSPGSVAYEISAIVHCALEDRKPARTPVSTEAFGLYLNACAGVFLDGDNAGRMLAVTRRLVKAAPQFAGAHAMHAIAAANAANELTHSPEEAAALHAEAKAAAETALRIDPRTPKAYSGLALDEGALADRHDQNWGLIEQYVLKALKIDPDLPPARNEYATMLRAVGRLGEALEVLRTADRKDPRAGDDPRVAMLLAATGDLDGAEAQIQDIEANTRRSLGSIRWVIAFWWEEPKSALAKIDTLTAGQPKRDVECFRTFLMELPPHQAGREHGLPGSCDGIDTNWRVRMLARKGDVDGAFDALGLSAGGRGGGALSGLNEHARLSPLILYYPEMKAVRRDPRFWPLATRLGLTDYWLKSGHWPDFCHEPDLPYDCRRMARAASTGR